MAYWSVTELAKLALVRADVRDRLTKVRDRFERETGERIYVQRGWVSLASQAATYADSLAEGFRAAPPDDSYHPKGAAVDVGILGHVTDAAGDQRDPLYKKLADIAEDEGLDSGFYFKSGLPDPYHLQAKETLAVASAKWESFVSTASETGQYAGVTGALVLACLVAWGLT